MDDEASLAELRNENSALLCQVVALEAKIAELTFALHVEEHGSGVLREKLQRAYAEIRKQVFATKAVFDREIVDEAKKAEE